MDKQRSWRLPAISLALYACFWATASVAGWFADRPFMYQTRQNWFSDLSASATRWLPPAETLMAGAAIVFLLPAIIVAAIYCVRRYDHDPFDRWFERPDAERTVAVLSVAIAVAISLFVSYALIRGACIIDDEYAYLFQADLFAHGKIGLPTPPDALMNPMIIRAPLWTSGYPPGQSLVLAPSVWLHAQHAVLPILAGVFVVAVWSFARDMFGPRHGALAALLAGMSPFVWAIHGTVMAFGTTAVCLAVFLAAIGRAEKTGRPRWMLLAGLAIGLAFITRPYDALAFSFPFAVRLLWEARRQPARLVWCVVGFVAVAWLLLAHDYLVTGSVFDMPYNSPQRPSFNIGFYTHAMPFSPHIHTPAHAVGNLVGVIARLDLWALAWPGSLALVLAGALHRRRSRGDEMLRLALASYVVFYLIVPFPMGTWDVGPTYYYALMPVLIPLAVRGVWALRARVASIDPRAPRLVAWIVLGGIVVATTAIAPIRAVHVAELSSQILSPWQTIEDSDLGPSIVLVPGSQLRRAPGWAFGHPYTLTTRTGATVQLIIPEDRHALDEAVKFLGAKPLYTLQLDNDYFARTGDRVFSLVPMQ
ncbi:MAG: glycosyltransferase family 39 protein [Deltaproteobacteria bacterium]